jgi:uncharacterized membrane protein
MPTIPKPHHPVVAARREGRDIQAKAADAITRFAGSMKFVYIHIVWFSLWILLGVEEYPFGGLTLIVSLEAIFLSTFVMISQNRQSDFAAAKADHDFNTETAELHANTELTRQIHELTKQIHALMTAGDAAA